MDHVGKELQVRLLLSTYAVADEWSASRAVNRHLQAADGFWVSQSRFGCYAIADMPIAVSRGAHDSEPAINLSC